MSWRRGKDPVDGRWHDESMRRWRATGDDEGEGEYVEVEVEVEPEPEL